MKILQINKYFYKKGGAETVFFNTIHLLEKHGHTVIPFALKNKKNEPSPYESYFVDYPELSESSLTDKIKYASAFIYNREVAKRLEKLIIKEKPDIAHIHLMFNSLSVSILPVLRKHHIPTVMSVHDYRLICPAYTFTDGKGNVCERCEKGNYYNCLIHKCSKGNFFNSLMLCADSYFRTIFYPPTDYIDRFIFVSEFAREKHIQFNHVYEGKSVRLYNFTPDIKDYTPVKGDYLLFFGRMSGEKGIGTLLKAIKQTPDIKLKIAGTGPLLEKFKTECPPNVKFLGFKRGEELRELIHNASFVVVPSEWYENNPMTIIESLMIGTPVIGSDIGGIPELIEEGKTGYTFKPKDADQLKNSILKARSLSDAEYERMSASAKRFALDNFSEESHYQKLMENYRLILNLR